jgi:NADH-quinone oxidoreductase subunit H
MIDAIYNSGLGMVNATWWSGMAWPVVWNLIKIIVVVLPLFGASRISDFVGAQADWLDSNSRRAQPCRPWGLLQPIADALKLLTKEILVPTAASKGLCFYWDLS